MIPNDRCLFGFKFFDWRQMFEKSLDPRSDHFSNIGEKLGILQIHRKTDLPKGKS